MERDIPGAIVRLAGRQQGNVSHQQLVKLGLGRKAITYRVKTGRLFRVHPTVYAVGRPPQTPIEKAAAAVLACGPTAALSHSSALALWGLSKRWSTPFEVTVTKDRRPRGITVHRSTTLARQDVTRHFGIRVTTPARTLHDCEPHLTDAALARAVNDALRSHHLTDGQLTELLARCPSRRLAGFTRADDGPTRSQFEDGFLTFCKKHRLPRPKINTVVAGREVDAYFEAEKLIVELDGWDFHRSRESFEDDRERDANALLDGIGTVRLTWVRMTRTAAAEAARLRMILAARR